MKKIIIAIFLLGALFAQTKVRIISGATNTELKLRPDGTVIVSNVSTAGLMLSQTNGAGALIVSNTSTAQIKIMPTNSPTTWLYVSNVGPTVITASNLVVDQNITNTVSVNTVASIPLIVSNILLSGQSGVWQIIVSNGVAFADNKVNVTNAVTVSGAVIAAVTNSTPFRVIVSNAVSFADNSVNATNLLQFKDGPHNSLKTTDIVHGEIHSGNFYKAIAYSNSVADAGIFPIVFAATNKKMHYFVEFASTGQWTLYRYSNVLITNLGTPLLIQNQNGNYTNDTTAWILMRPVITNYGTSLGLPNFIPGGTGNGRIPVSYATRNEVVLQSNTTKLLVFSNFVGAAVPASCIIYWYEE